MARTSTKAVETAQEKKFAALAKVCAAIQGRFGKESVNFLGNQKAEPIPRIPSGSDAIDCITGGGYPLGRIIEIFGPASSGKTTGCYHAIAQAQKMFPDKFCAFVDSEYSFDAQYAEALGVNVSELVVAQPDSGTDAFAMVQALVENGASMVVIDSVAAMLPREEAEEEDYGKSSVGTQARMMSKGLRKLTAIVGKHKCVILFTNQMRDKIGVMYGDPSTVSGGKALQYYASIRLKFTRIGKVEEKNANEKLATAIETKVETVKNKTFAPFKTATIQITFGKGIDNDAGVLDIAIEKGIVVRKGGNYYYNDEKVALGMPALKEYLEQNPNVFDEIRTKVKELLEKERSQNAQVEEDNKQLSDDEIAEAIEKDENTEVGEV